LRQTEDRRQKTTTATQSPAKFINLNNMQSVTSGITVTYPNPNPILPLPLGLPEPLDFQDLQQSILSDFMDGTRQWLFNRIYHWITTNPLQLSDKPNPNKPTTVKLFWLMDGGETGKSVVISKFLQLSSTDDRF
jgi:hypothetical protein